MWVLRSIGLCGGRCAPKTIILSSATVRHKAARASMCHSGKVIMQLAFIHPLRPTLASVTMSQRSGCTMDASRKGDSCVEWSETIKQEFDQDGRCVYTLQMTWPVIASDFPGGFKRLLETGSATDTKIRLQPAKVRRGKVVREPRLTIIGVNPQPAYVAIVSETRDLDIDFASTTKCPKWSGSDHFPSSHVRGWEEAFHNLFALHSNLKPMPRCETSDGEVIDQNHRRETVDVSCVHIGASFCTVM